MSKQEIKHPDRPADTTKSPYSFGVACDGWLYVSGQGPLDLKNMTIVGEGIEEQTRLTMQNLETVLKEGGCTLDDVVKCTCYLDTIADFDAFTRTYMEFFNGIKPARTTLEAKLWGGILVEVDCIARIPDSK
jgi:2-iminobutanoate/2-iminopropanoate deaminase